MFLSRITPPEGFRLGPVYIYYYSLVLAGAIWLAYSLVLRQAKRFKIGTDLINDSVIVSLIAGILGARLGFVGQNLPYFTHHFGQIFRLPSGGLSIHGAIAGAVIGLWFFARKQKIPFLRFTDCFTLAALAGQIVGRLGNYFNQELFGYPTNLPWKLLVDPAHRPGQYLATAYFHPTFLYEMLLNLLGLIILFQAKTKKKGVLTLLYLMIIAVSRFTTEIFRISDRLIFHLSLAQLVSIFIFLLALGYWLRLRMGDKNLNIRGNG